MTDHVSPPTRFRTKPDLVFWIGWGLGFAAGFGAGGAVWSLL